MMVTVTVFVTYCAQRSSSLMIQRHALPVTAASPPSFRSGVLTCRSQYSTSSALWPNFVKLTSKYRKVASWADPAVSQRLGLGWIPPISSSPSLQSLLRDHPKAETVFADFSPSLGTSDKPASTTTFGLAHSSSLESVASMSHAGRAEGI